MLASLDAYSPAHDIHEDLHTSKDRILDRCFTGALPKKAEEEEKLPWPSSQRYADVYAEVEDFEGFIYGVKRRLFFSTLRSVYQFGKQAWAK